MFDDPKDNTPDPELEAEGRDASPAPEDRAESPPETVAEDLAAAALRAAQEAVSSINTGGSSAEATDTDAASADADAAMAAMMMQQGGGGTSARGSARPVDLPAFEPGKFTDAPEGIALLSDVNLDVTIELGRTRMYVEDVLKLGEGAVVELDKLAGDPVDIFVNKRLVARGEVLILNDNFCVRISEIVQLQAEAAAG